MLICSVPTFAFFVALLITSAWPTGLMADDQFEARHPFLYLSAPLTGVSKPNQPLVEIGFAIRKSSTFATGDFHSSRHLPLVRLAFTGQGLRNWSALGIDMTKLHANDDSSDGTESPSGLRRAVMVGGVALLITAAIVSADCSTRASPRSTRDWLCS